MGSDLQKKPKNAKTPTFIVFALPDPIGASLVDTAV
jgi:hypothetical protein